MKRTTRIVLAGLAAAGGAVTGAGMLHNRRPDRRERLFATVFAEPGFVGRNTVLTWNGSAPKVVPLSSIELPHIGSIRLERLVYRFRPDIRLPNPYWLWRAVADRSDEDGEAAVSSFIAIMELAGMFSMGFWHPVREPEARSGVRLWAARPATPPRAHAGGALSDRPAHGAAAASGERADPGSPPWHDVLADATDLGSWSTRTRYLELGYHAGSGAPA